jgi:DNA-binding ferritin-like protein
MRTHPTIALVRMLSVAPVIAANWSIESSDGVPEGAVDTIREQVLPLRPLILEEAMLHGLIDFGWVAFEKIFEVKNGKVVLTRLKPLLPDISTIMIGMKGEFAGIRQTGPLAHIVDLDVEKCLLTSFAVEGSNWYGNPRMENARLIYNKWMECDVGAARYDKKIAGAHWVIYYPPGETGGQDNFDIAMGIMASMEASGSVVVPSTTAAFLDELNNSTDTKRAWEISFIEDAGGKQATFCDRLRYLDSLMARALITPERAVTEGQMGTKAEAGIHADAASTAMDLEHQHVARLINWHLVNQLLRLNYGPDAENTVWIVPAPMDDTSLAFLREVYKGFLTNPVLCADEYPNIDKEALRERIGVPALAVEEREEKNELDLQPADGMLPQMLRGIIASHETPGTTASPVSRPGDLLGLLLALRLSHHTSHLQASGAGSLERHKLFGQLYENLESEYDGLAEMLVVRGGPGEVAIEPIQKVAAKWVKTWQSQSQSVERAQLAEEALCSAVRATLKLDNVRDDVALSTWLQDLAKAHETAIYVLNQAASPVTLAHPDVPLDSVKHEPSQAQKEAGNYKKAHFTFQGIKVTIENPKLSVRRGSDPESPWAVTMPHHYGYIRGTTGADGDHVDCIIGPDPESERAWVVSQNKPDTDTFDEHKVMLGFKTENDARNAYDDMYEAGFASRVFGSIVERSIDELKAWLKGKPDEPLVLGDAPKDATCKTSLTNDYSPHVVRVKGDPDEHVAYGSVGEQLHLCAHCGTCARSVQHFDNIAVQRQASQDEIRKAGIGVLPTSATPTPGADPGSLAKDTRRYGGGIGDYPAGGWDQGHDKGSATYKEAAIRELGIGL